MIRIKNVTESDINWVVLEGSVDGFPQVTQRRSIHAAALADGSTTIAAEVASLTAIVESAYRNWKAAQSAIAELETSQFQTPQ